jgi:hypothetical protein
LCFILVFTFDHNQVLSVLNIISMQNMESLRPFFEQAKVFVVLDQWSFALEIAQLLYPSTLLPILRVLMEQNPVQNTCN